MSGYACARVLHRTRLCTRTLSSLVCHQYPLSYASISSRWHTGPHACCSSWACSDPGRYGCRGSGPVFLAGSGPLARRCLSTRQDLDFQLSRVQIDSILRANEQAVSVPEFDGRGLSAVRRFESNQLPANTPNEDRRSAATCLQTKGMLFGVFDGHGGWACAQAVSERLLYYAAVAMMSRRGLEALERSVERGAPVTPILQWYRHHSDYSHRESAELYTRHLRVFWQELLDSGEHGDGMSPPEAMDHAFRRLDTDISLEAQIPLPSDLMRSTAIQVAFAGCTACVAHVGPEGIHVANAGDSRAVLGVQEEDGSWSALPLSWDHNAQNQAEMERIRAQHPPSERDTVVTDDRLLGVLMPLRSFGDVQFKWSRELQQSVLESLEAGVDLDSLNLHQYTPPNYLTPPYLDAAPQLAYHRLRPQDRFLILGSDGLWDELGSEQAVRLVGEHLSGIHLQAPVTANERQLNLGRMLKLLLRRRARATPPTPDGSAATHLVRHALGGAGGGHGGELCQERLAAMLALPEDLARMYRDDITVTVVFLNSDLAKPHHG